MLLHKPWIPWFTLLVFLAFYFYHQQPSEPPMRNPFIDFTKPQPLSDAQFTWAKRPLDYPIRNKFLLPNRTSGSLPPIQHVFSPESGDVARETTRRRDVVKSTFIRAWNSYKTQAWLKDELKPISGESRSDEGWALMLINILDMLWITDLTDDFAQAIDAIAGIDLTRTEKVEISVFETTVRFLGGLLGAHDLCGNHPEEVHWKKVLLDKAIDVGNFLYAAFDTPNRMPVTRWTWSEARYGRFQEPRTSALLAEIGSLSLEFTRLSQLTNDPKFFDAVQRVTNRLDEAQKFTIMPGLWPVVVNLMEEDLGGNMDFSLGAKADSAYENLLKEYLLLGGQSRQYWDMYSYAIETAERHLFFRPKTISGADILFSGNRHVLPGTTGVLDPAGQHLSCFLGGMLAIGSKVFDRPDDLNFARKLVDGCSWGYKSMPTGLMPELFHLTPCPTLKKCDWAEEPHSQDLLHFPEFYDIEDKRYLLRPEHIESLFVLYRITGDETLREEAWKVFVSIEENTITSYGNAALKDVTRMSESKDDRMDSFWTAQTLKYFYLIFSPPDLLSLDAWVFNTEAHPFKRP